MKLMKALKLFGILIAFSLLLYAVIGIYASISLTISFNYQSMLKSSTNINSLIETSKHDQLNIQKIVENIYSNPADLGLKCSKRPSPDDLNITDIYWQVTTTSNGTFYLYNAYFDDRNDTDGSPVIRILGLINVIKPTVKTFCQFWHENATEPIISDVYEYRYIWKEKWGNNSEGATPYLISCKADSSVAPKHVSIVEKRCGSANNLLQVKNKRTVDNKRQGFLVSVKRHSYNVDLSLQIIEWCEILKILGVDKVEIFVIEIHPNTLKVLEFYESEKFVSIKFIEYPSDLPNFRNQSWFQSVQNQLIAFHDTFYENMYSYDYVVPMDTDEFIMPLNPDDETWNDLLTRTIDKSNLTFDSYTAENYFFLLNSSRQSETFEGIPKKLYFLSNVFRAANVTPKYGNAKSFLRTDRILTIHNHLPISCLGSRNDYNCTHFDIDREDGQLSHYRFECDYDECLESLMDPVRDESLWRFKDQIMNRVGKVIEKIQEFSGGMLKLELEN